MPALVIIVLLVVLAPTLVAFGLVPREVFEAWPILALSYVPTAFVLITNLFFRAYRPLIEAPLPKSAAEWLKGRLELSRKVGLLVAASDRVGRNSFFHPATGSIVLADDVHGEHTARAYATAAHELGHAYFHTDHPTWSNVVGFARRYAGRLFQGGVGFLLGATLVGSYGVAALALGFVGLAVVLEGLVVIDEAAANVVARRELDVDLRAEDRRTARGHLRRALATYVSMLLAFVTPLVAAPWLLANIRGGLIVGGPPLVGGASTIATILAVACVIAGLLAVRCLVSQRKTPVFTGLAIIVSLFWTPLLTTLLYARPGLPAYAIALAIRPAWAILSSPGAFVVRWLALFVGRDLDAMPLPFRTADAVPLKRISMASLAGKQRREGFLGRLASYEFAFWAVPLAIAWLLRA